MSSDTGDSLEIPNITIENSSSIPNELQNRTEELKQSLIIWRHILVPLNNLLEWEHKYDPLIIIGILSFIFIFIHQVNPPVITLVSCIVLLIILIDLLGPIGIRLIYNDEDWTSINDVKYTRLCEHIAHFEQHIKSLCESAFKIRQERPLVYLMIGSIFLSFIAFCGQRIDNLLLSYLTTLLVCITPGIRNQQLIPLIHQSITNFWNKNNKKSISSSDINKTKIQ